MNRAPTACTSLVYTVYFLAASFTLAQSVPDYSVRLSADVQTSPARITLSWSGDMRATNYIAYRKSRDATTWGSGTTLGPSATNYVDSGVTVGSAYEYRITKYGWTGITNYSGYGYIYSGIQVPLTESRGKVVLVVDSTFTSALAMELTRLQQDLTGDGWTVLRHDVPRMAVDPANTSSTVWAARASELASVKALVKADYNADPSNVKAVLLFGHVPVPYSGNLDPDGHLQHLGAWPADVYYGEMNSSWTDSVVDTSGNSPIPSDTRNWNVPGDGKFDWSIPPSTVELQVGRVDLANLPAFSQTEGELLRQYLNKDHYFRHKLVIAERRGLVDDHFGTFDGEAFAVCGWRNFAPFFGVTNTVASSDWFPTLSAQSFLWGYGCGSGTRTSAGGVGSTSDFAANDPRVVFMMSFGSWFGDWDSQNNFLRAPLATPTHTLTSAWAGRPYWEFHHMALGETIGFSTRVSQNNSTTYAANIAMQWIHSALMGDPTLRLHPVAPPSGLIVLTNISSGVVLSWNASPGSVAGYHVYRATTAAGPFTRLTTGLLISTGYTNSLVNSNIYMVRAVKLEVSASGSYSNASQGIFQSLDPTFGAPTIFLVQPTNNATLVAPIQLNANTFDPANTITNVAFYTNGVKLCAFASPPYSLAWSNVPLGTYLVSVRATASNGFITNSDAAFLTVDNGGAPRLTVSPLGQGSNAITGEEILGRTYRLQFVADLQATNWQPLGTATADLPGTFQFIDSNAVTQRFYRTVYP